MILHLVSMEITNITTNTALPRLIINKYERTAAYIG
jgi:hypothetical protein